MSERARRRDFCAGLSARLARKIITSAADCPLAFLEQIDAAWPALTSREFLGGYILADFLTRHPGMLCMVDAGGRPIRRPADPAYFLKLMELRAARGGSA